MQRIVLLVLFIMFAASFGYFCCKDNIVAPDITDLRALNWTLDTLAYPGSFQTEMTDIWGSSANDVYVVGHNSLSFGVMYHFDGKKWTDAKLHTMQGGNISGAIDFAAIYGFGPDDVWAGGEHIRTNPNPPPNFLFSSLLIHFNGSGWHEVKTPEGNSLTAIWGSSPNDIWIGGINGTFFHYDGVSVKKDSIPLSIPKDAHPFWNVISITGNKSSGEAYMLLIDFGRYRVYLLGKRDNTWAVLDSSFDTSATRLWTSPSETFYYTGDQVYKRQSNLWIPCLEDIPGLRYFDISGADDNNLLVVGTSTIAGDQGEAFHYNGADWYQFKNLQLPFGYYDVWTDGNEVFILGLISNKSIIVHGK